ncbi:MAG: hypothetical protein P8X90_01020 [Desulfobacterales bacterium]|jgi:imidazolonepropionase-like amidohydrolase
MEIAILTNARILHCTGADPLESGAVVIEGERIKDVVSGPVGHLPDGAQIIDCRSQTLLPGLIDAHVHIGSVDPTFTDQQRRYITSELIIR